MKKIKCSHNADDYNPNCQTIRKTCSFAKWNVEEFSLNLNVTFAFTFAQNTLWNSEKAVPRLALGAPYSNVCGGNIQNSPNNLTTFSNI